jgi:DNA-binding MarR family transcriptional regulator
MRMTANEEQPRDQVEEVEAITHEVRRRLETLSFGDLRTEITLAQYRMLSAVHKYGPVTIGKLSQILVSAQSTTSESASRLLKAGLVSKVRGIYDGRVVSVEPTDEGRQLLRRGRKRVQEAYQRLASRLSPAERDVFMNALKQLNELLGKEA